MERREYNILVKWQASGGLARNKIKMLEFDDDWLENILAKNW